MAKRKADSRWRVSANEVEAYCLQNRVTFANEQYTLLYPVLQFFAHLQNNPKTAAMRNAISVLNAYTHQNKVRNEPYFFPKMIGYLNRDKILCTSFKHGHVTVRSSVNGRMYIREIPMHRYGFYLVDMRIDTMEQLKAYVWALRFAYRMGLLELPEEEVTFFQHRYS